MEPIIVANKYRLVDTLYQSNIQNVYVAEDVENITADQFIINEILEGSIIYALKEVFNEDAKSFMKNFLDYFYKDSTFYIVSSISSGTTLDNYLSSNNLRISDKMYITENLLAQLIKLESANRMLKYHLLNIENISIAPNKAVTFNLDMKFDKEGLYTTAATIINKLGNVICCIFANTPQGSLEKDKDSLPPAIAAIIKKCGEDNYSTFGDVYKDFKASLFYSTFIDSSSVDKMVIQNLKRASRKRSFRPVKRIAMILIIASLLAGGYYINKNLNDIFPAISFGNDPAIQQNQIPSAKFSMSKSKVYAGDMIDFVSESTDPDLDDKITSYEWSVSKDDDVYILFSRDQNPSYTFDKEGSYVVSLIVKDSKGISSVAYKQSFTVHPKEVIPETPGTGGTDSTIRK